MSGLGCGFPKFPQYDLWFTILPSFPALGVFASGFSRVLNAGIAFCRAALRAPSSGGAEGGCLFYLAQSLISQRHDCLRCMSAFRNDSLGIL